MDINNYTKALHCMIIEVIIRANSSITLNRALNLMRDRANSNAEKFPTMDVKVKLTDMRNGNIYEIYSDRWCNDYDQPSWWYLQYDNVSVQHMLNKNILTGSSVNILITSDTGIVKVDIKNDENKQYNVFLKLEDTDNVKVELFNEKLKSFMLRVKETSTVLENNIDCSKQPITVNAMIVYNDITEEVVDSVDSVDTSTL